jgi:acyl carrier protein
MHTDGATLPMAPDHLLLWCNRGDERVATFLYPLESALAQAGPELVATLQRPSFRHLPDYEFEVGTTRTPAPAAPLLWRHDGEMHVRFDPDFLDPDAHDALAPAHAAEALFERNAFAVTLRPGDLLAFDNRRVLHARGAYAPRYDGTDRWLQCMYVMAALRPCSGVRIDGRMVTFPQWDAPRRDANAPGSATRPPPVTVATIAAHLHAIIGRRDAIGPDTELGVGLGVDSYALIDLTLTLERTYGVALADEAMLEARTVADVVRAVAAAQAVGASA